MRLNNRILFITVLPTLLINLAFARTIEVGEKKEYQKLSEAVLVASDHDTILLSKGIYFENFLEINKQLTILGINDPILDGRNKGTILLSKTSNINIDGITFQNTGRSSIKDYAAIRVQTCKVGAIKNNKFINTYFAIHVSGSNDILIKNNFIKGNAINETSSGNGIHIWKSYNIIVEGNKISYQRDGIYFEFSRNCIIKNNLSQNNVRYGLHFMFSPGNKYISNTFQKNGAGVAVMYTENIEMVDNEFYDNWGPSSYGLLLKDISRSTIKKNRFRQNTIGIYMEGASALQISENLFEGNGWALKLLGNCENDSLISNTFERNTFDLVTNSFNTGNNNYLFGNFWDKYKGYNLNKDPYGDVPYRPVSLFSIYVERIPSSVVLIKSFLVDLLDVIEKAFPSMIPETLIDEKPLMTKSPAHESRNQKSI